MNVHLVQTSDSQTFLHDLNLLYASTPCAWCISMKEELPEGLLVKVSFAVWFTWVVYMGTLSSRNTTQMAFCSYRDTTQMAFCSYRDTT
jgi:hypothetical protein